MTNTPTTENPDMPHNQTCNCCGSVCPTHSPMPDPWFCSQCLTASAEPIGVQLLKALGIDHKNALSFTLHCEPGNTTVTVTRFVLQAAGEAAAEVLERFRVVPVGPTAVVGSLDESVSLSSPVVRTHHLPDSPESDQP